MRLASCAASAVCAAALCLHRQVEELEVLVGSALGGKPGDLRLEHEPRLEPLQDRLDAERGDEEAPVDLELDEAVAREPAKRLADRATRDPELVGELALADPRPGHEHAADDHRANLVVGEADDGAGPATGERTGKGSGSGAVDIRCSNLLSWRRPGRKRMMGPEP